MILGATTFFGCVGYIAYMRFKHDKKTSYAALQEDGSFIQRERTSRWD